MPKSSKIIQFVLKDVQAKIHKFYTEHGVEITIDSLEVERQLFGTNSNNGWINEEHLSTLHMTGSIQKLGIYEYKNTIVSIAHKDIYGRKSGSIELQGHYFGNLAEPEILSKLRKTAMLEIEDWVNANLKHESLLEPK